STCPACIFPVQSAENTGVCATSPAGGAGATSVTWNVPGSSDTAVPVDEPGKELGSGLVPVTLMVNSPGAGHTIPAGQITVQRVEDLEVVIKCMRFGDTCKNGFILNYLKPRHRPRMSEDGENELYSEDGKHYYAINGYTYRLGTLSLSHKS
ncbi:MAG: hypothetical protein ACRD8W_13355, partial [Nitrososphaeraceae archaeon]